MKLELRVHEAHPEDVYRDRVRIRSAGDNSLKEGRVYRVFVGRRSKLVEVRGDVAPPRKREDLEAPGYILIDDAIRRDLGLAERPNGEAVTLEFRKAAPAEFRQWLRESSDPRVRVTAQIADEQDAQARRFNRQTIVLSLVGLLLVFKDELGKLAMWGFEVFSVGSWLPMD